MHVNTYMSVSVSVSLSMSVFQIGVSDPKLCFDSEKVLSLAKTIRNLYENVHKNRNCRRKIAPE